MKTEVSLKASADCPSHALANISIRDLTFAIDEPVERGGTNAGPTPTDTAIAALVGCTNIIGHKCADRLGVDIGHLTMDADCVFDRRGVTLSEEIETPFVEIRLTVHADGSADEDDLRAVALEVEKYCPLSKLFRAAGTRVATEWRKA